MELTQDAITLISLAGLTITAVASLISMRRHSQHLFDRLSQHVEFPLRLARDQQLFQLHQRFAASIGQLPSGTEPIRREFTLLKLETLIEEAEALVEGTIVFTSTETWRIVYRKLLESLAVRTYYSVAWVRSRDYWNDAPGRHSLQLNYQLVERGYRIERVLILAQNLWPVDAEIPSTETQHWIDEQQDQGIHISIVRESELTTEPDLCRDFGIYGDIAVGTHELDDQARTVRYRVQFNPQSRRHAYDCWERLSLYGQSWLAIREK